MSDDHVDEAMREMIDGRDKQIASLRAKNAELKAALEKSRQVVWARPVDPWPYRFTKHDLLTEIDAALVAAGQKQEGGE